MADFADPKGLCSQAKKLQYSEPEWRKGFEGNSGIAAVVGLAFLFGGVLTMAREGSPGDAHIVGDPTDRSLCDAKPIG